MQVCNLFKLQIFKTQYTPLSIQTLNSMAILLSTKNCYQQNRSTPAYQKIFVLCFPFTVLICERLAGRLLTFKSLVARLQECISHMLCALYEIYRTNAFSPHLLKALLAQSLHTKDIESASPKFVLRVQMSTSLTIKRRYKLDDNIIKQNDNTITQPAGRIKKAISSYLYPF
ncbi:UNVERIFIED_CONTAM: hypothetical protein K2H54_060496 [Gekko kuhli]